MIIIIGYQLLVNLYWIILLYILYAVNTNLLNQFDCLHGRFFWRIKEIIILLNYLYVLLWIIIYILLLYLLKLLEILRLRLKTLLFFLRLLKIINRFVREVFNLLLCLGIFNYTLILIHFIFCFALLINVLFLYFYFIYM